MAVGILFLFGYVFHFATHNTEISAPHLLTSQRHSLTSCALASRCLSLAVYVKKIGMLFTIGFVLVGLFVVAWIKETFTPKPKRKPYVHTTPEPPKPRTEDYIVVSAFGTGLLEERVNFYIKQGYEPVGSVSTEGGLTGQLHQPMRKKSAASPPA